MVNARLEFQKSLRVQTCCLVAGGHAVQPLYAGDWNVHSRAGRDGFRVHQVPSQVHAWGSRVDLAGISETGRERERNKAGGVTFDTNSLLPPFHPCFIAIASVNYLQLRSVPSSIIKYFHHSCCQEASL